MTRYIETTDAANTARAELQDLRNQVIAAHKEAITEDRDLAHHEASILTEKSDGVLVKIRELEAALIDWQKRWPDEHTENDCDGDCPRDHDEERADSLSETRWEEWRDAS